MTVEQRLDDMLSGQDQAELDREVFEILEAGRVGPMRVLTATRNPGGNWTVYLNPNNPEWTCTVCGGPGKVHYWGVNGGRTEKCYFCKGKGIVTDPRKVSRMPNLAQFKPRGE